MPSFLRVDGRERGGCVDGVSISLVLAISTGARISAASAAAVVVANSEPMGDGDERMSSPPGTDVEEDVGSEGSGKASTAHSRDLRNVVSDDSKTLWINVLFVPFQTPHAPSLCQRYDTAAVRDEIDRRAIVCADAACFDPRRPLEDVLGVSGEGDLDAKCRRLTRGVLGVLGDRGAADVKYDEESSPESSSSSCHILAQHIHMQQPTHVVLPRFLPHWLLCLDLRQSGFLHRTG